MNVRLFYVVLPFHIRWDNSKSDLPEIIMGYCALHIELFYQSILQDPTF